MSLLGVGLWAQNTQTGSFERTLKMGPEGQIVAGEPIRPADGALQTGSMASTESIISGADIGFRLRGVQPSRGTVTGTWVVRVNGQWVEVGSGPMSLQPAVR
jgi:hypothetical protein